MAPAPAPEDDARGGRRRAAPGECAARAAGRAARGLRARAGAPLHHALVEELPPRRGLLPARLLHDEAQPEAARAGGRAAGPRPAAPAPGPGVRPGRARADVAPAGASPRSPVCPTCRCSRAPAPTASSPACCSRAPTTRTAASSATKVLTPDTAHGTNPATVTMAGYEVVKVGTATDGGVDLDDLRAKADEDVACLMLTNPNTLGLFDTQHRGDRRDRARRGRHALLRRRQPQRGDGDRAAGRHGLRHRPLQPAQDLHPAARRRWARRRADRLLGPDRAVPAGAPGGAAGPEGNGAEPHFDLDFDRPKSIGKLRGFQGNFGVFVRTYAYIRSLGGDGLKDVSQTAVLNANYLKALLARGRHRRVPADRLRPHLHARVRALGARAPRSTWA